MEEPTRKFLQLKHDYTLKVTAACRTRNFLMAVCISLRLMTRVSLLKERPQPNDPVCAASVPGAPLGSPAASVLLFLKG